jgi:Ca2+-binding EF-hand superfamily protein
MKTNKTIALVTLLGLALTGAVANAQVNLQEPASPPRPPRPPHVPRLTELLDKYDVNQDGQLDQSELAALKQEITQGKMGRPPMHRGEGAGRPHLPKEVFAQYDVNQDGNLDETEREALHQDIEAGKVQLPPKPEGLRGPAHRPSPEALLQKFDADQDGKLNETELGALLKANAERRGPPHRGGGRGGPGQETSPEQP